MLYLLKIQEPSYNMVSLHIEIVGKFKFGYNLLKVVQFCLEDDNIFILVFDERSQSFQIYQSIVHYEFQIKRWKIPYEHNDINFSQGSKIYMNCKEKHSNYIVLTIISASNGINVYKLNTTATSPDPDQKQKSWVRILHLTQNFMNSNSPICLFNNKLLTNIKSHSSILNIYFIDSCDGIQKKFINIELRLNSNFTTENGYENLVKFVEIPLSSEIFDKADDLSFCPSEKNDILIYSKQQNFMKGFESTKSLEQVFFNYPKIESNEPFNIIKIESLICFNHGNYFQVVGRTNEDIHIFTYALDHPLTYSRRLVTMEDVNLTNNQKSVEFGLKVLRTENFIFNFYIKNYRVSMVKRLYLDGAILKVKDINYQELRPQNDGTSNNDLVYTKRSADLNVVYENESCMLKKAVKINFTRY